MALHGTISHLKELLHGITHDLGKAEGGNKAAAQRVRTQTVRLEKIAKAYRKESISNEKQNKGVKKTKKAAAPKAKKAHHAAAKKPAHKAPAKSHGHAKVKAKPKAKAALARPRALSFKRPTAKLPVKRAGLR